MTRNLYPWLIALAVTGVLSACGGRTETPSPEAAAPSPSAALSSPPAPVADGAALLRERCTACHGLDRVERAHKKREEWERTVDRMIRLGAKLTEAERAVLVEYLAEHY
ncbi:MAG: hypothetical protein ACUVSH_11485, partial [Anaerolineae bacterium]